LKEGRRGDKTKGYRVEGDQRRKEHMEKGRRERKEDRGENERS
jgi:hypothetical protein